METLPPATAPMQMTRWTNLKQTAALPGDHLSINTGFERKVQSQQEQKYSLCMDMNSGKSGNYYQKPLSYVHTRYIYGAPWRRKKQDNVRTPLENTVQSHPTQSRRNTSFHTSHTVYHAKHQLITTINSKPPSPSARQQPTALNNHRQTRNQTKTTKLQRTTDQLRQQKTKVR
jgi:hypothetical protein